MEPLQRLISTLAAPQSKGKALPSKRQLTPLKLLDFQGLPVDHLLRSKAKSALQVMRVHAVLAVSAERVARVQDVLEPTSQRFVPRLAKASALRAKGVLVEQNANAD
mmetsp:Transcript_41518/g.50517  ORF Transcript_41518/g.50517 Transcript_41518/m.50517 type:complete len:107 (-) Transcript_41518:527-847(-)